MVATLIMGAAIRPRRFFVKMRRASFRDGYARLPRLGLSDRRIPWCRDHPVAAAVLLDTGEPRGKDSGSPARRQDTAFSGVKPLRVCVIPARPQAARHSHSVTWAITS